MKHQLTPHFALEEFTCPCCYQFHAANALKLALRLEPVRDDFGPVMIWSGYRCERHNLDRGGKINSLHLLGLAADIAVSCDSARFALIKALLDHGFIRIGIAKLYVHADLGTSTGPVLWTYYR